MHMTVKVVGSNGDAGLLPETPATPKDAVGLGEGAVGGSGLLLGHTVSGPKELSTALDAPVRPRTGR